MPLFDLCVVGGGVLGLSVAYQASLAKPEWSIILLEKSSIGGGASSYAAALSSTLSITKDIAEMSLESDDFYREFRQSYPSANIRELPIHYIVSQSERLELETTSPLDENNIANLKTYLPFADLAESTVLSSNRSLHIDPQSLLSVLSQILKEQKNVTILEYAEVCSIVNGKQMSTIVETTSNEIVEARNSVLTLGPWSFSKLAASEIENIDCRIKKIVAMKINIKPSESCPVICFPEEDAFLLPNLKSNDFLFSINSPDWDASPENPKSLCITEEDRAIGYCILEKYAPKLIPHYCDGRVFCDVYTRNAAPIIHQSSSIPKLTVVTGGNGRGFRLAPSIAKKTAEILH